jgi:hypothetical protein
MKNEITKIVSNVMRLLVDGRFDDLVRLTRGRRLTSIEIQQAVVDYGRRLMMPPESAYRQLMEITSIETSEPSQWSVEMPLWTREEGQSDLTIELTVTQTGSGHDVEIDDIHVL